MSMTSCCNSSILSSVSFSAHGHELLPRSFRLHGNIVSGDGVALEDIHVSRLIDDLLRARRRSGRSPLSLAVETLGRLSARCRYRFPHGDAAESMPISGGGCSTGSAFAYPLLATEQPKGPIVKTLHGARALPVVFIDDMAAQSSFGARACRDCLLLHLMPDLRNPSFRAGGHGWHSTHHRLERSGAN